MACGWELAHVTAITEEITRDDRTDAVHVRDRCVGSRDGMHDVAVELAERRIVSLHLVEKFCRQTFAFVADRVDRLEPAECRIGRGCRQISCQSTLDHFGEHGMEPTDRTGTSRGQLMMTTRQQPQHLSMIVERNDA